jgi:hypothetical protein
VATIYACYSRIYTVPALGAPHGLSCQAVMPGLPPSACTYCTPRPYKRYVLLRPLILDNRDVKCPVSYPEQYCITIQYPPRTRNPVSRVLARAVRGPSERYLLATILLRNPHTTSSEDRFPDYRRISRRGSRYAGNRRLTIRFP